MVLAVLLTCSGFLNTLHYLEFLSFGFLICKMGLRLRASQSRSESTEPGTQKFSSSNKPPLVLLSPCQG